MSRGATLAGLGRINDAMASYRRALEIAPDYPEAHFAMGNLLHALGRGGDALASLDRALALRPDYAQAHSNRGIVLAVLDRQGRGARELRSCARAQPPLCRSVQQPQWRAALLIAMKRRWRTSNAVAVNQPFNLAYQGHDGRDLRSVYGALGSRIAACAFPAAALPPPPAPHEPVRVGIVSGFFYLHSNWKIPIKGWLSQLDRRRFQIFGYYTGGVHDAETEVAAGLCHKFVHRPLSAEGWRNAILADAPHVLIYPGLSMEHVSCTLAGAAARAGPVRIMGPSGDQRAADR